MDISPVKKEVTPISEKELTEFAIDVHKGRYKNELSINYETHGITNELTSGEKQIVESGPDCLNLLGVGIGRIVMRFSNTPYIVKLPRSSGTSKNELANGRLQNENEIDIWNIYRNSYQLMPIVDYNKSWWVIMPYAKPLNKAFSSKETIEDIVSRLKSHFRDNEEINHTYEVAPENIGIYKKEAYLLDYGGRPTSD